jgi:hypothetical protein
LPLSTRSALVEHYPKVIEPTVGSLEAQFGTTEENLRWTTFNRVPLLNVAQVLGTLPESAVHIFCNTVSLDDPAALLLTYNVHGLLYSLMWKDNGGYWTDLPAPPEMLGDADLRPSVRLVFKDERAQQAFLVYLQQVQAEKVHNPSLQLVFSRLACKPVIGPVAIEKVADGS